jgi:acetyl esterase/lipase
MKHNFMLSLAVTIGMLLVFDALSGLPAHGADQPIVLPVWPDGPPDENGLSGPEEGDRCIVNITEATLTLHLPPKDRATGAAVLICPGGGYSGVCVGHEGEALAKWLNTLGVAAGVVKYRLPNGNHRVPIQDAQRALQIVRSRAAEWGIQEDKVGVMGFSAGGHLASTVGTHFEEDYTSGEGDAAAVSRRPDFMILGYPVITMGNDLTHSGSRRNLLGEDPSDDQVSRFSNHLRVTDNTPPTFIVYSDDDDVVPPKNAMLFYNATNTHGVPAEVHIYDAGGHGYGLAEEGHPAASWPARCEEWMGRLDLLGK